MIQNLIYSLPELSHVKIVDNIPVFYTVTGRAGIIYKIKLVDIESNGARATFSLYESILKAIPPTVTARLILRDSWSHEFSSENESRSETIRSIGYRRKELILTLEWNDSDPVKFNSLPMAELMELGAPLPEEEIETEFNFISSEVKSEAGLIETGASVMGVFRIYQQGVDPLDERTLAHLLESITSGFELVVSVKKVDPAKTEAKLNRKASRDKMGSGAMTAEKVQAAEDALRSVSLYGHNLFEIEWVIVVERFSEKEVRTALNEFKTKLSTFGTSFIETFGAYKSFVQSRIGAKKQHVTFNELSPTVLYFLPICTFGEGAQYESNGLTTLLVHRQDESIHGLDVFSAKSSSFNQIVTGKAGSGKSVFGNVQSRALLNNPQVHMIKVDVGGSYKRECEQYGGLEICFNLNNPSGIDPFKFFSQETSINDTVSVLTEFLSTLALEEHESYFSREMKGEFEKALKRYLVETNSPSFSGFLKCNPDLPRSKLLARWDEGGVYENAICSDQAINFNQRYIYFNFENIQNAANPDYVAGVMAAVIAKVNLDLIYLSLPKNRALGKKLVFFCDETKFFLEKNGTFFLLTSANFRKFGHSNILTGQNIHDFVLKINGKDDIGLILNSPIRVFFESAADAVFLKEVFSLSSREVNLIRNNLYRDSGKEFRHFILQDDTGTRSCKLCLTSKEYYSTTSSRGEVDQINKMQAIFPELPIDEVINIILHRGLA